MSWKIDIPVRAREDELGPVTISEAVAALPEADRAIARTILRDAWVRTDAATFGDVLDQLESTTEQERLQILNDARVRAGLHSTTEVDSRRDLAKAARDDPPAPNQPMRDKVGRAILQCSAASCRALSVNEYGHVAPVSIRRYWCPVHANQAEPGDLDPWTPPPIRVNPVTGMPMPTVEAEAAATAHYAKIAARSEEEARKRREQQQADQERIAALEEANRKPLPAGFGPMQWEQ